MKYLVIGAGGTGGPIGAYLTRAGKDVTLIARGEHLRKICSEGLKVETSWDDGFTVYPNACEMEEYRERPDVVFVCVKGYSLDEATTFLRKIAHPDLIVIPILNLYGTGERLQRQLSDVCVLDGCIYVSANIARPGVIYMHGKIFRVVYGVRSQEEDRPVLGKIREDLEESGICAIVSENIKRDALQKFSYVSPMASCGLYYDAVAGDMQKEGKERTLFVDLIREIEKLAQKMGISFTVDLVENNLKILDDLAPSASTSMQRDIAAGKQSEIDGLLFEVVRLGEKYGVPTPAYQMVAEKFGSR
ncbi:MAG: 2-dehydropantoate 2-reductase [Robinsoniella sp.]|nr:2-dehydropantoate 2-reductase [Robinsoniella sp.]